MDGEAKRQARQARVHEALTSILPTVPLEAGGYAVEAARYALMAPGKRVRPCLLLATAEMLGVPEATAMPFALALEMIHTYSLIHDDLPAMDDDTMRRGQPSCHVRYGEAQAILAGDGLLNFAYETLLAALDGSREAREAAMCVARAAGFFGMVGGQSLDLMNGRDENAVLPHPDVWLDAMHSRKTGALLRAAVMGGAALGKASHDVRATLATFATALGMAFQWRDDILDATASSAALGKTSGKDARDHKVTAVTLYGVDEAMRRCRALIDEADAALTQLGDDGYDVAELRAWLSLLTLNASARAHD